MDSEFNAHEVLAAIREARAERRKRCTCSKSKLDKHLAELIKLRAIKASYGDMAFWLLKEKRVKIDRSNIMRFLKDAMRTPVPDKEV